MGIHGVGGGAPAGGDFEAEGAAAAAPANAAANVDAARKPAARGVVDLGMLSTPGSTLKGGETLGAGQTLRFTTAENQITGIYGAGSITSTPAGLQVKSRELKPRPPGVMGGRNVMEYTFQVPKNAKPGTVYTLTTNPGMGPAGHNPDFKFSFTITVK